MQQSFYL